MMQPEGRPQQSKLTTEEIKRDTCHGDGPTRPGSDATLRGRSQLGMKLERCHLKMSSTKWRWCSRLAGLRKPILTSLQALGPREAPEALVAPSARSPSPPEPQNACLLAPPRCSSRGAGTPQPRSARRKA